MYHVPVFKWSAAGTPFAQKLRTPDVAFGFLSLIAMDTLFFFSTAFWRRNFYNVFRFSHILGVIFVPIGVVLHMPSTLPWMLAAAGAYGLDHLIRVFKTRVCNATLRPIPELGMTRIEIPHLNAGWRPGQHVRLRVLSTGLGILGWSEIHPFTIASANGDGLTLMVKKTGDWTDSLYNIATKSDSLYSGGGGTEKKAKVWIEGPYGGVGNTMMDSYSGAVFVVGGSGITFALSSIADLVQKDVQGLSRLKAIHLIWCVQDPGIYSCCFRLWPSLTLSKHHFSL
jgi:ferric-chelate reductase